MIIPISAGIALDDRIDTIEFSDKYAIFNFILNWNKYEAVWKYDYYEWLLK